MYLAQFPDRRMPDHRIFQRLHRHFREARSFHVTTHDAGRQSAASSTSLEENILKHCESTSYRFEFDRPILRLLVGGTATSHPHIRRLSYWLVGESRCLATVQHDASQYGKVPFTIVSIVTKGDFTNTKKAHMNYLYRRANGNGRGALPMYHMQFPYRRVATVAEWYRYRTVACFVTSSSPVPLKTRRVGQ
ncbi:hypothetical protein TNCV_354691 [Trichonephila clavipes]|uniref:Uncharacterized protein n=1 Tax=Trichonephila clavipes TaxID=2585209 RepID=A0A8X6W0S3_TRICX|nr:hypothetical protein TNCV_354691 [Trichonephila clavipes]